MCYTKPLFPPCHPKPGKLHPLPRHPRDVLGAVSPCPVLGKEQPQGYGAAEGILDRQNISKGEFNRQRKSSEPWLTLGRRSIRRHQQLPSQRQSLELGWSILLVLGEDESGRGWALGQALDSGVIPAGISSLPRWKQNSFRDRAGAGGFSTADSASPALPSSRDFKPVPSKGNWRNRLTSSILACWQIPSTDFVTHRLCLQWNDLGIEGLSNMDHSPTLPEVPNT